MVEGVTDFDADTYLPITSSGFSFLLKVDQVSEIFHANNSFELLDDILLQDSTVFYWRGHVAHLHHLNRLFDGNHTAKGQCYIVCKSCDNIGFCIFNADDVSELIVIKDNEFKNIDIYNDKSKVITSKVYMPNNNYIFLLIGHDQCMDFRVNDMCLYEAS